MFKRMVKSGIAIAVAFTMLIMPNTFTSGIAQAAGKYDEAAAFAQQMAQVLTAPAGYGETSVQYALMEDGVIVLEGQAGVFSQETKAAPTKDSMYGIGSVSKMYTAAAVMQLVDEGKVDLDTPVVTYLPEFKMADKRYKDITVRMLLNHSSGLMGSTFSNTMLFGDNDSSGMDNLLKNLSTQRLKAAPGAFSVYCNDGFSLAQLLVEKVSKESFSDYIAEHIAKPLAMNSTKTPLDTFDRNLLAKVYQAGKTTALPTDSVNAIGAGGVYSTAEDMCRFAQMFMYNTDDKVLSDEASKAMANKEYLNGIWCPDEDTNFNYGLGWDSVEPYPFNTYGIKALVKGGDTLQYHASLVVLPEENIVMAVLSSGGASTYNQVFAQEVILKTLLADGSIKEIKPIKAAAAPEKAPMPAALKENAGYYAYMGGIMKIDISDEGVVTIYSGAQPQMFSYAADGRFYSVDGASSVSFEKESNGQTYFYVHAYGSLPYLGQSASSSYQLQKISENKLSGKVKTAWEKRNGKIYYLLNEKYTSQTYALSSPITRVDLSKDPVGYYGSAKIMDANTAKMMLQIPGMSGRDLSDITFYTKGKNEYLTSGAAVFVSEDAVKNISTKASYSVTIASDGYAKWYEVGAGAKNKTLKVITPKNGSVSVYDSNGNCIFNSITYNTTSVTLPAGGFVVFAGDAGAKFQVKIK